MSLDNMTADEVQFWAKGYRDAFLAIAKTGLWRCPACGGLMPHPPKDYSICPCCRREFGYDFDAPVQEGKKLWPLEDKK